LLGVLEKILQHLPLLMGAAGHELAAAVAAAASGATSSSEHCRLATQHARRLLRCAALIILLQQGAEARLQALAALGPAAAALVPAAMRPFSVYMQQQQQEGLDQKLQQAACGDAADIVGVLEFLNDSLLKCQVGSQTGAEVQMLPTLRQLVLCPGVLNCLLLNIALTVGAMSWQQQAARDGSSSGASSSSSSSRQGTGVSNGTAAPSAPSEYQLQLLQEGLGIGSQAMGWLIKPKSASSTANAVTLNYLVKFYCRMSKWLVNGSAAGEQQSEQQQREQACLMHLLLPVLVVPLGNFPTLHGLWTQLLTQLLVLTASCRWRYLRMQPWVALMP
jgi:hypothetical protein